MGRLWVVSRLSRQVSGFSSKSARGRFMVGSEEWRIKLFRGVALRLSKPPSISPTPGPRRDIAPPCGRSWIACERRQAGSALQRNWVRSTQIR